MPENTYGLTQGPTRADTTATYWHRVNNVDFYVRDNEPLTQEQLNEVMDQISRVYEGTFAGDGMALFNETHGNKKVPDNKPRESSFKLSEYLDG